MSLPSRLPAILQAVMQGQPQALADSHYPQWHLAPVNGLLNDPNGFCQVAGRYHMFYQWNPLACDHTYKCWGHWSSADLLHWRHEPIALMPDEEYDRNGCYSGSAVEFEGALTLCSTACTNSAADALPITSAVRSARLTRACETPGTAASAFCTRETQLAQLMPLISSC